ncbi:MAG: glycosyltransferase family 4 protein [bacterium]|nr:glycosyltransferase family 4 protein [bacterium]
MKRTLFVTLDFPPRRGGVARYYDNLVKGFPAEDLVVLAPPEAGSEQWDAKQSYKIIRAKLVSRIPWIWPRWLPTVFLLLRIIDEEKIQSIHVGQVLPLGTAAAFVSGLKRLPFFIYTHGLDVTLPQAQPRKKGLMKDALKRARLLFANSLYTKKEIISLGLPDRKIEVLTPGCEINTEIDPDLAQNIKTRYQLEGRWILLTVGRLEERKGHDQIIRAVSRLRALIPHLTYCIVGEGPDDQRLRAIAKEEKVADRVVFAGSVADEELSAWYSLASVFIMVPRVLANRDVEGFGIVYLEAGAFALPVIGGRSGGVSEAILERETGLLVDPYNVHEIAGAIGRLHEEPDFATKLGQKGKERVRRDFRWPDRSRRVIQLTENS